jgi:hypothetical protein
VAYINGDASAWKEITSHAADATLFGGWGGYERGWAALEPRWEWACHQFGGGEVRHEEISTVVLSELAYTVELEHYDVILTAPGERNRFTLRVTHIYRYENDAWRMVHRHADEYREQHDAGHGAQVLSGDPAAGDG